MAVAVSLIILFLHLTSKIEAGVEAVAAGNIALKRHNTIIFAIT